MTVSSFKKAIYEIAWSFWEKFYRQRVQQPPSEPKKLLSFSTGGSYRKVKIQHWTPKWLYLQAGSRWLRFDS